MIMLSETKNADMVGVCEKDGKQVFSAPKNFEIDAVFTCGQCFRFDRKKDSPSIFCGVADGKYIEVEKNGDDVILYGAKKEDMPFWSNYFSMDFDYEKIGESFKFDKTLYDAYLYGSGIRILRQDPFETLISFIISQNNNIPRIKGIIKNLCESYGEPFTDFRGQVQYAFPSVEKIAEAGERGMKDLRMGFRAGYVFDAAKKIIDGEIELKAVYGMETKEALEYLMRIKGVGMKVASCAALFAFGKYDAFPIDVWVKRILQKYYDGKVGAEYFGEYGGIAQQYLFYYERRLNGINL